MKNKLIRSLSVCAAVILVAISLVARPPQTASAAAFTCQPGFYQLINGVLERLDATTGNYNSIGGTGSLVTNAAGYNSQDNFIYGINNDTSKTLVKIESDATTTSLGVPTGLSLSGNYVAGDFDLSGNLYVLDGTSPNTTMYQINVVAGTATTVTLTSAVSVNDIVFVGGFLYGVSGTTLYRITPSDGTVVTQTLAITPPSGSVYGAGWATASGELYFSRNTDGVIYKINGYTTTTPVATPVLDGQSATGNDGAACVLASSPLTDQAAVNDSYTMLANTTLSVSALNGVLPNDTGQNRTVTAHSEPSHGSVTINADGSFVYIPTPGFVGTDSFTYTMTDDVGVSKIATVTIVVKDAAALAATGQNQVLFGLLGLGLLVGSAVLLAAHRRRLV